MLVLRNYTTRRDAASISIAGPGFTGTKTLTGFTVAAASSGLISFSNEFALNFISGGGYFDFTQSKLTFTIPSITGATSGHAVTAFIQYRDNDGDQINTSNTGALIVSKPPPIPSPGPLSILGAGAAFGFSRSMRRRIAQSVLSFSPSSVLFKAPVSGVFLLAIGRLIASRASLHPAHPRSRCR